MSAQVTGVLLARLAGIAGEKNVLTDPEELLKYAHDELAECHHEPDAVVRPASTAEVAAVVKACVQAQVPVTPRGQGTGLAGGAVPVEGGIVLSLERMKRILEVDEANLTATVEPGVVLGDLHRAVEAMGLFYPPDPASLDSCSVGGTIAENSGGPRAVKYGVTRDYVCGLEVVLPDGEVVTYGGKVVKNVAGYDLTHWFVGSEGTLGVITQATVRLLPLPSRRVDLLVPFDSFELAAEAVLKILHGRKILPPVIEFMDRASVAACEEYLGHEVQYGGAAAQLIIGLEGATDAEIEAQSESVAEVCFDLGAADILVADDASTKERLWKARRLLLETLKATSRQVELEDVVVPRSQIPSLLKGVNDIGRRWRVPVANFGHAGDGNVHVAILRREEAGEEWTSRREAVVGEIFALTCRLGGTITGEHGVGFVKRKYLPMVAGERELRLMRQLKHTLDPQGLMNPRKVLPDE